GVQPHYLVRQLPFKKDEYEKIVVNEYFQVPERENIYVVGDNASSEHSPSAQLAGLQGEQIAEVLYQTLHGSELKEPKEIKLRGTLGSLGKNDGFGSMFQQPLTGLFPR